ncbi:branched-chain amino acid ABC transporter permease [Paraburkholderia caballeronis]|uniref:Amino acid/amide ABC transporter membrane protein 2, HAAT family n=1 Tax=Paraburkholderia caballeronis TaxID=416943 RepID=A0A1H7MYZ7_9BURK|nr:branched-chain amino acid ABC transporter permease [Paraburkholderia caballeronis]PXW26368.1 amino acid/amide ABC transporter membrane protein 2 (HAAT family) [Paraburkholderia caballeronis]PXX01915.1 amino acid/amide ABC transporter membrane protein 2 (HAAT family) [Paraburkholderia caballeronis]RAK01072.1 amino acid/amide ABC transporter membrane protein 2 (HAAT family) [Paraburkholderia caballeronis]SEB99633.1 amino acid/amide ABC transporter membrane protein 2, HAAT family [Paraburkholde
MRDVRSILIFGVLVAGAATALHSGVLLNFLMMALYAVLLSQAWNILGGYGGQLSFGHALFFGVGAYTQAIAQLSWGWNPWLALPVAIAFGLVAGVVVGLLAFRGGLRGSYFALVTLAFAEVARIVAVSVPFTGGGVGLMVPLHASIANLQFGSRRGYIYLLLVAVCCALALTAWLRHSRFGAYLQAVRDNENAARAVGVDPVRVKLGAIAWSAAFMSVAGACYVQMFQYIDAGIAFGPSISVQALVGVIVGGVGTLWGPVLGAALLYALGEVTRNLFGELPGLSMVIYGAVLVVIVMFMPRGLSGAGVSARRLWSRPAANAEQRKEQARV